MESSISNAYVPVGRVAGGVQVNEDPESFSADRSAHVLAKTCTAQKLTVDNHNGLQVLGRAVLEGDGDGTVGTGPRQHKGLAGLDIEGRVGEAGPGVDDNCHGSGEGSGELHGDEFEILAVSESQRQ